MDLKLKERMILSMKRILILLLALCTLLTAGCASSSQGGGLTNPPGHSEAEALIGLTKAEALEKLGIAESNCTEHPRMPHSYRTTKTVEFAGLTFDLCLSFWTVESENTTKDVVRSIQYIAVHEGSPSDFGKATLAVAKELEKDYNGKDMYANDELVKVISLSDMQKACEEKGNAFTVSDYIEISDTAPQNVTAFMEYIITTDFWKNLHWDDVSNAPDPASFQMQWQIPKNQSHR